MSNYTEVWSGDVGSGALIATYYYDPFGRRLWKDVDGTRTCFVYSDEGLIGEYDSTGAELKTYGYTPDSQWSTAPLFCHSRENGNPEYYFYRNDHLGTPQKLSAVNGAVAWSTTYESFGKATVEVETVENNLRFPGQYYDQETGLYYNLYRYYDPATGRYLRTDSFGDGLNLYAYCYNNPIVWIDPMGLCVVHPVLAAGGLIPAFGIVPDLIDAAYYVLEGDWENAGYSGLAAIPVIGQGARGVQYGRKALKYSDEIAELANASKSGLRTASEAGISPADATRLQNAANRTQQRITVVGSRAEGTAKATSDWDYIMSGKSSQRHSARSSVPRGTQGGEINSMGRETGIDVFQDYNPNAPGYSPLNTSKPHVVFEPQ